MWDDEQELRGALRGELAQPAPPAASRLSDVVRRGRRQRRVRQTGAAIAVLALVTGTGAAIAALGPARANAPGELAAGLTTSPSAGPDSAASDSAAPDSAAPDSAAPGSARPDSAGPDSADWPRVDLPARTPYATWSPGNTAAPPPGRTIMSTPLCDAGDTSTRRQGVSPATDELRQRVHTALTAVAGPATVGQLVARMIPANPEKVGSVDGYDYSADISDANGTGSLRLTIGDFTGNPTQAADQEAFDLLNCEPPKRTTLPNGTVLQLYPVLPREPFQSLTHTLRIYLPDGTRYQLEVHNFGSPDFTPNPQQPEFPNRVGAGRDTLPLTERQLAALGLAVAG